MWGPAKRQQASPFGRIFGSHDIVYGLQRSDVRVQHVMLLRARSFTTWLLRGSAGSAEGALGPTSREAHNRLSRAAALGLLLSVARHAVSPGAHVFWH